MNANPRWSLVPPLLGAALVACSWSGESVDKIGQGDGVAIPPRYATVVSDGCTPDTWQAAALASSDTRRVVKEVVLLCAVPRASGDVGPADPSARQQLASVATLLHGEGYKVRLGVSFTDETAERFDGAQTARLLGDPAWRGNVVKGLSDLATALDGVEIGMQQLPGTARADVVSLMKELSTAVRGSGKQVAFWAPPSTTSPSDVPGGDAVDLTSIAPYVDRVRVMTLDFASPGAGPTIDQGWAVSAVNFARGRVGAVPVDVSVPLYGNDVSDYGTRMVSFLEARALADVYRLPIETGPTGELHLRYTDDSGHPHDVWFDDADSISRTLRAWDPATLPLDVGVVFYGLGDEDPAVWPAIARGLP